MIAAKFEDVMNCSL